MGPKAAKKKASTGGRDRARSVTQRLRPKTLI